LLLKFIFQGNPIDSKSEYEDDDGNIFTGLEDDMAENIKK